jgi:hypothetical protein
VEKKMTNLARRVQHSNVMAEIERASRHDARIGNLAERIFPLLPASRTELAEALEVTGYAVDRHLKDLRLAGYKIIAVGKSPNYVYELDYE